MSENKPALETQKAYDAILRDEVTTRGGNLERVKTALEHGANVDKPDFMGNTPLNNAIVNRLIAITDAILYHNPDVNISNHMGKNPLQSAAINGDEDTIRRLLNAGADVHKADNVQGNSPLHWAAMCGNEGAVKLLLAAVADPKKENDIGQTAADTAKKTHKLKSYLFGIAAGTIARPTPDEVGLDMGARNKALEALAEKAAQGGPQPESNAGVADTQLSGKVLE